MKSIHKLVYAAVLTLSALNFAPSLASAQDAAGTFTLTREVHWQNAIVPAGTYRFTLGTSGPTEMLTLRNTSGDGAGFLLLVVDSEPSQPADSSKLVLVSRANGSFVQTMELPAFDVTLHFAVPAEGREVAQAVGTSTVSAAR
jgi:hypothetical protein